MERWRGYPESERLNIEVMSELAEANDVGLWEFMSIYISVYINFATHQYF